MAMNREFFAERAAAARRDAGAADLANVRDRHLAAAAVWDAMAARAARTLRRRSQIEAGKAKA